MSDTPRQLTTRDLVSSGIKVGELAAVLGVHRTTVSDLLGAKTARATPGAHAIVALWPHVSERTRKELLSGRHFSHTLADTELVITKSNTDFKTWWKLLNEECRKIGVPEPGFCDASATYEMRKSPREAASIIAKE